MPATVYHTVELKLSSTALRQRRNRRKTTDQAKPHHGRLPIRGETIRLP